MNIYETIFKTSLAIYVSTEREKMKVSPRPLKFPRCQTELRDSIKGLNNSEDVKKVLDDFIHQYSGVK